jgi:hypothetical protein
MRRNRLPVRPKVTLRNIDIAYKSESKLLGIHITENLKWNANVRTLSLKLSKVSCLIKSLQEIMRPCMIRSVYESKFQALLRYDIMWGGGGG